SPAKEFANVTRAGLARASGLLLLICTRACVPFSCWAAVPVHTQHCCVIAEFPTAGFDHGLCQRLYCFAWMKVSRLRDDLHGVHIGRVALEDSVSQEDEPVSDFQLQLLDAILVIECYAERESRGQRNGLGAARPPDQDRRGMSAIDDSCNTGGMVDPY